MIFLQDLQKMLFCFQESVLHLIISKWNLFNVHKRGAEKQAYARLSESTTTGLSLCLKSGGQKGHSLWVFLPALKFK